MLLNELKDRDAAHHWNVANAIRKERGSVRDKILKYMRANVGKGITNEELRYVAGDKTEWARRVRELRTEFGWPVAARSTGRPDLNVGMYVLKLIDRAQSMIGTLQMIYVAKSSAVTNINVKIAIGPIRNGILQTPGT